MGGPTPPTYRRCTMPHTGEGRKSLCIEVGHYFRLFVFTWVHQQNGVLTWVSKACQVLRHSKKRRPESKGEPEDNNTHTKMLNSRRLRFLHSWDDSWQFHQKCNLDDRLRHYQSRSPSLAESLDCISFCSTVVETIGCYFAKNSNNNNNCSRQFCCWWNWLLSSNCQ